jgi:xanthine dehydrogenase accessory factor
MDFQNLKLLEQEIKRGKEVCVFRIFDQESKRAKRIVFRSETGLSGNEVSRLPDSLGEIIENLYRQMTISRKLADIKDCGNDYGEENNGLVKLAAELLLPKLRLVVFGAGHVGQAVALVGSLLGFDVVVIDDRLEFASRKRLPDPRISLFVGDYSKVTDNLKLGLNSAVVIVTRGHQFDETCLRATLKSNVGYLGMIGSKRRVFSILNRLEKDGYARTELEKIHAPIGLHIGAKSPQEIAIAIIAEIITCFSGVGLK